MVIIIQQLMNVNNFFLYKIKVEADERLSPSSHACSYVTHAINKRSNFKINNKRREIYFLIMQKIRKKKFSWMWGIFVNDVI